MKIVIKEPYIKPYVKDVKDDVKVYQNIVGGYIEIVPIDDNIFLVCNETGKLQGLPVNFSLGDDVVVGTVFFVGNNAPEFRGLTDKEIDRIIRWFNFIKGGII